MHIGHAYHTESYNYKFIYIVIDMAHIQYNNSSIPNTSRLTQNHILEVSLLHLKSKVLIS